MLFSQEIKQRVEIFAFSSTFNFNHWKIFPTSVGLSRLGNGVSSTPSSVSPPSSPRYWHYRNKNTASGDGGGEGKGGNFLRGDGEMILQNVVERLVSAVIAKLWPGSVYKSPQVFERLWPFMEDEKNSLHLIKPLGLTLTGRFAGLSVEPAGPTRFARFRPVHPV